MADPSRAPERTTPAELIERARRANRQEYLSRALRRARLPLVLTGLSLLGAVFLLPGLIGRNRILGG